MKNHAHPAIDRALALLMALVLTLSLAVTSAGAVSIQDMNPKDDPLLGIKFSVDATIPLATTAEGKDVSLSIPPASAKAHWRPLWRPVRWSSRSCVMTPIPM